MDRVILHVDLNAFFASVEELIHPEYKAVPMAVSGDPESRRGIILAKNELAKSFGIKTAETINQAKTKCPDLLLVRPRRGLYSEYSERVNGIYQQYTDQVERFGIDESYLDVTGSLRLFKMDGAALAHEIRRRVRRETGLTVSVGVSYNKIFAKLGSDYKKPDAVTVISEENYRDIVWPLSITELFLVGKATAETLKAMNLKTIGELARSNQEMLRAKLGKMGEQLWIYANGLDSSPVSRADQQEGAQSIGSSITFKRDLITREDIVTALTALSDEVAFRLRRAGYHCSTLQLTIKDTKLKSISRQKRLPSPTQLAHDLLRAGLELIEASWNIGDPIRLLALTGQKLNEPGEEIEQLSFFNEIVPEEKQDEEKIERLEQAIDEIRLKYGKGSIYHTNLVNNDLGIETK